MSEEKGKPGRKTKRTPEVEARITESLRNGSTQKDACAAVGISWETFDEWCKAFPEFSEAVTRAEGECAEMMAACIAKAAPDDWRAAESWLKRRRREEWGDNVSHDLDKDIANILAALAGSQEA